MIYDIAKLGSLAKVLLPDKIPIVLVLQETGIEGQGIIGEPQAKAIVKESILELGGVIKRESEIIPTLALDVNKLDLESLLKLPYVKSIWYDFKIFSQDISWQNVSKIPQAKSQYNLTGKGQTVYIGDVAIDLDHPSLKDNIVGNTDLVNEGFWIDKSKELHATHVGGIIASRDSTYQGVAPDCQLHSVKILNSEGSGDMSTIIEFIDKVLALKGKIANLSLGGLNPVCKGDCPVCQAIDRAALKGLTCNVAGGNYGFWPYTICCPSKAESSLTVGAVDDNGNVTYWSSRSGLGSVNKPDFVTSGNDIISCKAGGGFISMSGTSMSTPVLSGMESLLFERLNILGKSITPQQLHELVKASSSGGLAYLTGSGIIDLLKMLESL